MKLNKTLLIALSIMLALPFFNSCRRGEKDPFLSLKSRNSRISAVWTLESGYYEVFYSQVREFRWADDECEEAADGNSIPLPLEFDDETTLSKTYNFSDALATYNQTLTTTVENPMDTIVGFTIPKNEFEDAHTKPNVSINFDYELTIKKNGEYKIYITYNHFEDNYPLYPDDAIEMQYGKTFSGTFEYVDNWHWTDNSLGTREGIMFDGFPLPIVNVTPIYDLTDITDIRFEFNFVNNIGFHNSDLIFELEKLMSKEMTFIGFDNENFYYQNQDQEFEGYLDGGESIDCQGIYTETTVNNINYYFQFTSDGKSVDQ
ncbi:MAG: hypothetical protein U9R19_18830 [Bacteroidota bacterium]|nr:hypothetical protein [Bacteroidota bacterium]